MARRKMLIMDSKDNVGVLLEDAEAGDLGCFGKDEHAIYESIEFGHKVALLDIPKGTEILKYGHRIGYATKDITLGSWVHTHNLESERGR